MAQDLASHPNYNLTMVRLEKAKRVSADGAEYWRAREIGPILGYPIWRFFEPVIERASDALSHNGIDPSHHMVLTHQMMKVGGGGQRQGEDRFLSRPACYLIAMNGDPAKAEIAAAQAYFAIQTRRMEIQDKEAALSEDEKRLMLRDKVKTSFKMVSGVAKDAGVSNRMQAIFHDARYLGLYGMSGRDVKRSKGLLDKENLFDRAGALELSANDFQMNLAADVIKNESIKGEQRVISTNKDVGSRVRRAMIDSGATPPEKLPLDVPIKEIKKKVGARKRLPPVSSSNP